MASNKYRSVETSNIALGSSNLTLGSSNIALGSSDIALGSSNLTFGSSDLLLTVKESSALLRISVPTFWRRVADGTIPKPVKLGGLSRWPRSEILEVIEAAKARRQR